jgi:hypothetical protein
MVNILAPLRWKITLRETDAALHHFEDLGTGIELRITSVHDGFPTPITFSEPNGLGRNNHLSTHHKTSETGH